jgi:hypothetical protein
MGFFSSLGLVLMILAVVRVFVVAIVKVLAIVVGAELLAGVVFPMDQTKR